MITSHLKEALGDVDARHIIPLSGGKDSTALAVYLSQAHPSLPFEYVFSDTGAELPETYEYFECLEHVLGASVTRISALDLLGVAEKPGRSPFDIVLYEHFAGYLPSPRARWCTRMLKIHPFEKHIGADRRTPTSRSARTRTDRDILGPGAGRWFCQRSKTSCQCIPLKTTG